MGRSLSKASPVCELQTVVVKLSVVTAGVCDRCRRKAPAKDMKIPDNIPASFAAGIALTKTGAPGMIISLRAHGVK